MCASRRIDPQNGAINAENALIYNYAFLAFVFWSVVFDIWLHVE